MTWPMSCTKCGSRHKLGFVSVSSEKSETISSWTMLFGIHRYRTTRISLDYPICNTHAFKVQVASLIGGKVGFLITLFAGGYLLAIVDGLLDGNWATMHVEQKVIQTAYAGLLLGWISLFSLSQSWSPVRLSRWKKPSSRYGSDTLRLLFRNEHYAREFARANRKEHGIASLGRSSWFHTIQWSHLIVYLMAAAVAWVYIDSKFF